MKPLSVTAKNYYVRMMMGIIGRLLEATSQTDQEVRQEATVFPDGFVFEMKVLPNGSRLCMQKTPEGSLRYIGSNPNIQTHLSIAFKHTNHAFLVFSFQESTAQAFANDRMIVNGELAYAIRIVRCLNKMEALTLPKIVAERAIKRYPNIQLSEKLSAVSRIYWGFIRNLVFKSS